MRWQDVSFEQLKTPNYFFHSELEVNLYIDEDVDCLTELSRFLPFVGYVGNSNSEISKNSFQSDKLSNLIQQIKVQ